MARPPQPLKDRFLRYVQKTETCWIWIGGKDKDGYGKFGVCEALSWDGKRHTTKATRAVLYLVTGQWPDKDLQVQHICDNPSCVRPSHLKLGEAKENTNDMRSRSRAPDQKGTWNGGVRNPENARLALLTWEVVRLLRADYATGCYSQVFLGKKFGVSDCTIRDIVKGRTWRE